MDAISTKDLIKELEGLYSKVDELENKLKLSTEIIYKTEENLTASNRSLQKYKEEFVIPKETLDKLKLDFEKEKFIFDTEKKFILREHEILREFVSAIVAIKTFSTNKYESGGGSFNHYENITKPNFSDPLKDTKK